MNHNEKKPVSKELMNGLSETMQRVNPVMSTLSLALLLICSEFMKQGMEEISGQISKFDELGAADSPEKKLALEKKAEYEAAIANLQEIHIDPKQIPQLVDMVADAPKILLELVRFLLDNNNANALEIIRIIKDYAAK